MHDGSACLVPISVADSALCPMPILGMLISYSTKGANTVEARRLKTVVLEKRKRLLVALGDKRVEIKELATQSKTTEAVVALQQMQEMEAKLKMLDEIIEEAS